MLTKEISEALTPADLDVLTQVVQETILVEAQEFKTHHSFIYDVIRFYERVLTLQGNRPKGKMTWADVKSSAELNPLGLTALAAGYNRYTKHSDDPAAKTGLKVFTELVERYCSHDLSEATLEELDLLAPTTHFR